MSNYIKSTSTYTLRKRSQGINGGAIYERDWTTLDGQKLRFGKGKTPLYNDGNFIFTTSNFQTPSKKNKASEITVTYTYDDVKDSKSIINKIELNENSNDVRTFSYYGSCVELVKKSLTHIIATFPASVYTINQQLEYPISDNNIGYVTDKNNNILYIVKNPFAIDLLSKSVTLNEYDNRYRFMCETYEDYEINGVSISGFEVDYSFSSCQEDDQWYNFKKYYENNKEREAPVIITFYKNENEIITKFIGFKFYDDIIFLCKDNNIVIKPKNAVIEKYFDNLKGFEKQLLNRKTKPLYNNTFITPIEGENSIKYVKRNYKWPTIDEYCIDIESTSYDDFVDRLLNMATIYDELWCNNLYNRMTHESIKNFDWTYTREYIDGEEQDNIEGGLRMQQILYLIGSIFDETKQYIDGIKNNNKCTYDNINNTPDAILSDKLELLGWDVVSTIPILDDNKENSGYVKFTQDFIKENNYNWYTGNSIDIIDSSLYDNQFMKRLLLNSKKILASKGTQESIDMIMGMFGFGRNNINGKNDFDIIEHSYEIKLNPNITKDEVERINYTRTDTYFDEDSELFQNLPLGELIYNEIEVEQNGITKYKRKEGKRVEHTFVIPFYKKDKDYLTDLYFHSKGGWGQIKEYELFKKYLETISYLNVVTNVSDLFKTDSTIVNANDIYYVVDLEEYVEYYGTDECDSCSHFFYYKPDSASTYFPGSWQNISFKDKDNAYYQKAMYLNDIITTKFGNNPHCGFGFYDNGNEFKEYMSKPFKYLNDNNLISEEETESIKFEITERDDINKTLTESKYNTNSYYLNSKVIVIKNNINNNFYKKYFKNIILHYLLQVIPSTTILILEDF